MLKLKTQNIGLLIGNVGEESSVEVTLNNVKNSKHGLCRNFLLWKSDIKANNCLITKLWLLCRCIACQWKL